MLAQFIFREQNKLIKLQHNAAGQTKLSVCYS